MAKRERGSMKKSGGGVEGAEFFKVYIPNFNAPSHQLLVPPHFVEDFKKTMKEKVILKNIHGKAWSVDVKETSDGVFFEGGWQDFVDYHGLKVGDFLVFRYQGCYRFIVNIFGPNGCKKENFESESSAKRVKSEEKAPEQMKPERISPERASPQNEDHLSSDGRRNRHFERSGEVDEEEVGASEQVENSKEVDDRDRVIPKRASFITPLAAHKSKLRILDELMKHVNVQSKRGMILRDAKGREWPVKVFTLPEGPTFLGKGLHAFHVDKKAGPNDRCKFTFGAERSSRIIRARVLRHKPLETQEKSLERLGAAFLEFEILSCTVSDFE